jgi:hypothetical protein
MPQYQLDYVKPIHKEGSLSEVVAAARAAMLEGRLEDVHCWRFSEHADNLYRWTGATTVTMTVGARSRRDAVREFLLIGAVPDDVVLGDIVVTELKEPAALAATRSLPTLVFTGLTGAGE